MIKIRNSKRKQRFDINEIGWLKWVLWVYAAIFPIVLFFGLEWLNPVSGNLTAGSAVASILMIYTFATVVFAVTGRVFWGYAPVGVVLIVAYIVNHFKVALTGQVFVPTDLAVAGEAMQVTQLNSLTIEMSFLIWSFVILVLHVPLWFVKFKPNLKKRLIIVGSAFAVFLITFVIPSTSRGLLGVMGVPVADGGSKTYLYSHTGLMMGFRASIVHQREHDRAMYLFVDNAKEFFENTPRVVSNDLQPNVIVVMSESFTNPNSFGDVTFSRNPAANLERLSAQYISGTTVVPVFGGGTANTELEFLTGTPVFFLSSAYTIPYGNPSRFFSRNLYTAMPWLFRQQGYRTVALHPNVGSFFNRDWVYPRLGFEYFVTKDDMPYADFKGWYISDEYFTTRMIEEIERANQDDVPLFLFGISIQNHFEFWGSKYTYYQREVFATSPHLTEEHLGSLSTYAQGVLDADRQLARLIEFLEESDRPTVLVFFGDHLPVLGYHYDSMLEHLGFISSQHIWEWDGEDRQRMFSTPYLVWDNFSDNREDWGTLSTYFLSAQMLAHSGIRLNQYWQNVLYANEYFRGLTENHYVDRLGNFMYIYGVWDKPHVRAFAGMVHAKWFGSDEFHQSLAIISE